MLRDSMELRRSVARSGRVAISLVIALATCAAVGLRANPASLAAEEPATATTPAEAGEGLAQRDSQPLSLDWVPNGSLAVLAIKPNELLEQTSLQPIQDAASAWIARAGVKPQQLDTVTVCWTHPEISQDRNRRLPVMALGTFAVFRSRSTTDWRDFRDKMNFGEKASTKGTVVYSNSARMSCFMPDEYTIVTGQTEAVLEVVRTGRNGTTNRFWLTQWDLVKDQPVAVLADLGAIRDSGSPNKTGYDGYPGGGYPGGGGGGYRGGGGGPGADSGSSGKPGGGGLGGPGGGLSAAGDSGGGGLSGGGSTDYGSARFGSDDSTRRLLQLTAPILAHAELLTAVMTAETNKVRISALITTIDEEDGKTVLAALDESVAETQRLFRRQQHSIARSRRPEVSLLADLMNIGEAALKSVTPRQTKDGVGVTCEFPSEQLHEALKRLAPAINAVSQEGYTAQTEAVNAQNLKQIMLAMHNYHDQHGHFLPSAVLGKPNGGPPVSWRVLLTPFLGREDIFKNYRFDEHWNSEHNARVTADMPRVFRHPLSNSSTSTCYFGVVSSDASQPTLFGPPTVRLRDVTDGTSNTLAIVEAKREMHWAYPGDLKFTPGGKLPELGGFTPGTFSAARADGSVAVYKQTDLDAIRPMLTIRDGQVVKDPARDRPSRGQ